MRIRENTGGNAAKLDAALKEWFGSKPFQQSCKETLRRKKFGRHEFRYLSLSTGEQHLVQVRSQLYWQEVPKLFEYLRNSQP